MAREGLVKPKIKDERPPVRVLRDGREVVNLLTKAGRDLYQERKRCMWERQGRACCLYGFIKECPGYLKWNDAVFAHEVPCGHDGGSRDDRTVKPGGKRVNGVAHAWCNSIQGSRRIGFNAAYNDGVGAASRTEKQ